MKKKYIVFSLFLVSLSIGAQTKASKKADQFFESYQYVNAIDAYLQLVNNKNADQHVYKNLADSYYHIFNTKEAVKWYEKAIQGAADSETFYRYAQCLKSNGNYKEANHIMDKFADLAPSDERAKAHKANPNYYNSLNEAKALFFVENTSFSTEKSNDFAPFLTNENELYFVSSRKSNKTDKWSNQPYFNIFKANRNENGVFTEVTEVKELNTPFHDGPVAISQDGNTMFFARDGHSSNLYTKDKKNNAKIAQLGIYKAVKVNGKWSIGEALPINSTSYSVSHPSLSLDGKTLYFSSNMPGGYGESDIWKIEIKENGYGKPENLGKRINTPGREVFPFIAADSILYFSSNGLQGFGGLDIFKVDLRNPKEAVNLGKPVNTESDDFSINLNSSKNVGYFASNRSGYDAIYQATPVCGTEVTTIITDVKTGKPIADALVSVLDAKNNIIEAKKTDNTGKIIFNLTCNSNYMLQVVAPNYETITHKFENNKEAFLMIPLRLNPNEVTITETEVILGNVYFEYNKSNITLMGAEELNKLVKVMQENPSMIIFVKSHTDSKGSMQYNAKLSEQRAQATVQYIVSKGINKERISGKGFGSSEPKVNCGSNCTEEENATNRRSEFIIVKK
ncbi:OmpA family protein [Flavobacterium sp. HXWNR69]|uniref:OmpA family protein n=1 Tax=Flavobacterium fragile TaxID=2949085 RepID=A0ABT0TE95_9FLAO|nr:OmpA family protein [Flavobacterium sp. HXWNR69]MCL9769295.1 OmpA family protein [Flavobacterium sp. HXWNR69]